jgi:H+/Cl- antiporter ClcA
MGNILLKWIWISLHNSDKLNYFWEEMLTCNFLEWFFAPLDGVDSLQPSITWVIAIGFGVLGYFVSRGLAHRLMNKERIRAYAPICFVVELVEIFCSSTRKRARRYMLAAIDGTVSTVGLARLISGDT